MTTLFALNPLRFVRLVPVVGLVAWGLAVSVSSVAAQGVDAAAAGQKTKVVVEPELLPIEGTVVDEGGAPVPKTRVRLYTYTLMGSVPTSLADAEGRFRFSADLASTRYLCFIADNLKDGTKAYTHIFEEGTLGLPAPLRLVLKPPRVLVVEVRDAAGKPVADAYVEVLASMASLASGHSEADGTLRLTLPADATADAVFAMKSGSGFDYWTNRIQPPGATQDLPDKLTLTLNGSRRVRIQAVDTEGRPVPGIEVRPWTIKKDGKEAYVNLSGGFASRLVASETDSNGIATIDWIPVDLMGRTSVLMVSKNYHLPEPPVFAKDMEDDIELTMSLKRTTKISGTVLAEDGKPAAGIILQAEGRGQTHYFREMARTNAAGRFEFNAYPGQSYLVAILDEKWGAPSQAIHTIVEDVPVSGIDFRLGKATLLHGVATWPGGKARADVTITLVEKAQAAGDVPQPTELVRWARTDNEGRYRFRVGAGKFTVSDHHHRIEVQIGPQQPEVIQNFEGQ